MSGKRPAGGDTPAAKRAKTPAPPEALAKVQALRTAAEQPATTATLAELGLTDVHEVIMEQR